MPHYENVPFEIPSSWVWTTGNEIFSPLRSCIPQGDTFIYVDIDAIDNKVNIINNPPPDSERLVKIDMKNRSCRFLFSVYVCCSFPAYRLKVYVQGYARYPDCRARLTTTRYNEAKNHAYRFPVVYLYL